MSARSISGMMLLVGFVCPAAAEARVAFIGLEGLGLDSTIVEPFEQLLGRELSRITQGDFLTPTQVTSALLEPQLKRLRKCDGKVDCLIDLGGVIEADFVIYGTLTELGDYYVLLLRAIDVGRGAELPRVRRQLKGQMDELIAIVRIAASDVLGSDSLRGRLRIIVDRQDAVVQVDGLEIGGGGVVEVAAGKHTVTIEAPGYTTLSKIVSVNAGGETKLEASLLPLEVGATTTSRPGSLGRWWPVIAGAAGVASLGVGGYFAYRTDSLEKEMQRAYRRYGKTEDQFHQTLDAGRSAALMTNITLGVGGILLSTALVGWLLSGHEKLESKVVP